MFTPFVKIYLETKIILLSMNTNRAKVKCNKIYTYNDSLLNNRSVL